MVKKIIVICPNCKKKMKITDKPAKYRCPHCGEIYNYTVIKKVTGYPIRIAKGAIQTVKDIFFNIKNKYIMARNAAKYMQQVKRNMKSDPNWSNVEREKRRMKEAERADKTSFFQKFKRNK
jgi:hypothetical protein